MSFKSRLARYKAETDYFAVDVFKGKFYETIHDLTWEQANKLMKKLAKDESVSQIDIVVEDWDAEDDYLFKNVKVLKKKPCKWRTYLPEFRTEAIAWK